MEKITVCYFVLKRGMMKAFVLIPLFISLYSCTLQAQITTGVIVGSPFCGCDSVDVPFTSVGIFNAGNSYTAELSDAVGSFATPVIIGTLADIANSGTIECMIPCGTITGTGYRIRVISSDPPLTGTDNGIDIIINAAVFPSVSITTLVSGLICTDTNVMFTANPQNGGTLPAYQWQVNGANVGTDTSVYAPGTLLTIGDSVSVTLTSNAACAVPAVVFADTVVNCVTIATGALTAGSFCACDSISIPFSSTGNISAGNVFTAELSDPVGSFAAPVNIGTLLSNTNSGVISCVIPCGALAGTGYLIRVTGSEPAVTGSDNGVNIVINTIVVPSVSITTDATTALCISSGVTFTATPANGGTAPIYQWQRSGVNEGINSPVYTSAGTFMNGEIITVTLTSNADCAVPATTQANIIIACPAIEIPNVFTPNGDGINDIFKINLSGENLTNFNINIYDRWGLLVFTSPNINYKWDGRTTSGLRVVSGTYFYVVDLNTKQYKGHITVLE